MKKRLSFFLCIVIIALLVHPLSVSAETPGHLTWDGAPATLTQIAQYTGQDMVDSSGNYKPMYHYYASELWNNGLFLGSDGSFDLDRSLTRAEGVVMTIRILGKEAEAKAATASVTFTDVPDWAKPYVAYAVQNGIASGYSTTTFGANDPMTAAQYITLMLRAMDYKDGTDFNWDKSYDKALEIGLIGQPCHTQYSRSNLFLRDNAAVIAYNAVFKAPTKSGAMLRDTITMPGKPSGSVPTAARPTVSAQATVQNVSIDKFPGIYIKYTNISGMLVSAEATYLLTAGSSGTVAFTASVNGKSVSDTMEVKAGETYYLVFIFAIRNEPNYTVSNSLKVTVGDYVYTDTINMNGTITNVYVG